MSYLVFISSVKTSFIKETMSLIDLHMGPSVRLTFPPGEVNTVKLLGKSPPKGILCEVGLKP